MDLLTLRRDSLQKKITLLGGILFACVLAAAIFGLVMSRYFSHDEELFVSAGVLSGQLTMYRDFIYGHLPNFPNFLNAVDQLVGTTHYLLLARLMIYFSWLLAVLALVVLAYRWTRSWLMATVAALALISNNLLLLESGSFATNSFIPIPFVLLGIIFFFSGIESPTKSHVRLFLSGAFFSVAIGLKANFVFVAVPPALMLIFADSALPLIKRLSHRLIPFAAGGIVAGFPTLSAFVHYPDRFLYSVWSGPIQTHFQYWQDEQPQNPSLHLIGRLDCGASFWTSGSTLYLSLALLLGIVTAFLQRGSRSPKDILSDKRVMLMASFLVLGVVFSFVPAPSFPQYFILPIPFAILLLLALIDASKGAARLTLKVLLLATAIFSIATNFNTYREGIKAAWDRSTWTGLRTYYLAQRIRDVVCARLDRPDGCHARIATLAPILALEAGLNVYPELGAGPFAYREADYLTSEQLARLPLATIKTLPELLDRKPPDAVLVGFEGTLDDAFLAYAWQHQADLYEFRYDKETNIQLYILHNQ